MICENCGETVRHPRTHRCAEQHERLQTEWQAYGRELIRGLVIVVVCGSVFAALVYAVARLP